MPKFHVVVPHPLSQQDAITKLNGFIDLLRSRYKDQLSGLEESWEGNVLSFGFKTYGIQVNGKITVSDHQLDLDGDLPIAAMMFKGKIESTIRDELTKLMGPAPPPAT
ncbi:MAG TPA: polyhydroxyalkanoic acid system family protein [Lacipirellulaceae bacterium]